jgi:hypothetical protein
MLPAGDLEAAKEEDMDGSCDRCHRLGPFHRRKVRHAYAEVALFYSFLSLASSENGMLSGLLRSP